MQPRRPLWTRLTKQTEWSTLWSQQQSVCLDMLHHLLTVMEMPIQNTNIGSTSLSLKPRHSKLMQEQKHWEFCSKWEMGPLTGKESDGIMTRLPMIVLLRCTSFCHVHLKMAISQSLTTMSETTLTSQESSNQPMASSQFWDKHWTASRLMTTSQSSELRKEDFSKGTTGMPHQIVRHLRSPSRVHTRAW